MTDLKPCPLCGSPKREDVIRVILEALEAGDSNGFFNKSHKLIDGRFDMAKVADVLIARWNALPRKEEEKAK